MLKPVLSWPGRETGLAAGTSWLTISAGGAVVHRQRHGLEKLAGELDTLLGAVKDWKRHELRLSGTARLLADDDSRVIFEYFVSELTTARHQVEPGDLADLCRWLSHRGGGPACTGAVFAEHMPGGVRLGFRRAGLAELALELSRAEGRELVRTLLAATDGSLAIRRELLFAGGSLLFVRDPDNSTGLVFRAGSHKFSSSFQHSGLAGLAIGVSDALGEAP